MLDAAVVIRTAGLRNLIRLPILNAADDHIIEPDRDFLHRHAGHDPAADQKVVAVVDESGADGGIDLDPDRRRRGGLRLALARRPEAAATAGTLASLAGSVAAPVGWSSETGALPDERARGGRLMATPADTDGAMPRL